MDVLNFLFVNLREAITTWLAGFLPVWAAEAVVHFGVGLILVVIGLLAVMVLTLGERKVIGRAQDRYGPNRWGPWGILTPFADAIKMLTKEDIVPEGADYWVHLLAPICTIITAVLIYAVLPFGEGMWGTDLNIGILYIVAIASLGTIAILMAGWSSDNKYSLLGAFRVVAQLISYEIPMVLSIVAVVLLTGSMSMVEIVRQQPVPHIFIMPLVFFVYLLAATAELYRTPFDMVEADSELVAGYFTEYSGMKFVMFFMAEYINLFAMSAIITTLFLGGWRGPILPGYVWFFIKCGVVVFFYWWVRSMMPRIRIDHLLNLAWKFLVPLALVNLMVVGLVSKLITDGILQDIVLLAANIVVAVVVIGLLAWGSRKSRSKRLQRITAQRAETT
jgi:NADH-quinone oxidoreductase subunit H